MGDQDNDRNQGGNRNRPPRDPKDEMPASLVGPGTAAMEAAFAACMAKGEGEPTPAPSPVVLKPGQIIQDYEILKPLGKGKFSIVYMAKQLTDGTMCALKKINIFDMMVPKQREKCLKEVKLLQSLDHPNIVKFLSSFVDSNELLIIVEWAEKGDLKRLIRRALQNDVRFRECELWEYSRQLSSAMDHMHGRRIMHRDLKPANIFVATDNSLKLGDLGLGRFFSTQTLEAFSKVGTPLYMSPEVLHGAGYDMRSDVWSLGCVLYELAMLRSPFKSDQQLSLYDLFVRISKGQYPPMPETISTEFRGLVSMMLQLEPAKRADCAQVLEVCNTRTRAMLAAEKASAPKAPPQDALASAPSQRAYRPPALLVMDDIVEKLKLLECEELFFRPRGYPLLHRCFFVQPTKLPGQLSQFQIMYELVQWLLDMLRDRDESRQKVDVTPADASAGPSRAPARAPANAAATSTSSGELGAGDAAAGGGPGPRENIDGFALPAEDMHGAATANREAKIANATAAQAGKTTAVTGKPQPALLDLEDPGESIRKLVPELKARGIQVVAEGTLNQLAQGHGEGVCLILNELINQELVGRDFHFEAPAWVGALGEDDVESLEEDLESDRASAYDRDEAQASDEEPYASIGPREAEPQERFLEPVYEADVDVEAWKAEVERVRPLLGRPVAGLELGAACSFPFAVDQARQRCRQIQASGALELLPEWGPISCRRWRDELGRVRAIEDRINASFTEAVGELARMRDANLKESAELAALQEHVSQLSSDLAEVTEQVEQAKAETAGQHDVLHDPERLSRLKQAFRRLRDESCQLDVRAKCLQRELFLRPRGK
mmetsp:Transcript_47054/g.131188  ORF Transcript_47054/g.131188 Transcript_47054/m.131188 type:complete len:835 (+) Transcript_47054:316-2820(+)